MPQHPTGVPSPHRDMPSSDYSDYFCKACGQGVRKNPSRPGAFEHSINPGAAYCSKRNAALTRAEVEVK